MIPYKINTENITLELIHHYIKYPLINLYNTLRNKAKSDYEWTAVYFFKWKAV